MASHGTLISLFYFFFFFFLIHFLFHTVLLMYIASMIGCILTLPTIIAHVSISLRAGLLLP